MYASRQSTGWPDLRRVAAAGQTSRAIADLPAISEHTVERHRERILEKLGIHDRVALTRNAIRRGLIQP